MNGLSFNRHVRFFHPSKSGELIRWHSTQWHNNGCTSTYFVKQWCIYSTIYSSGNSRDSHSGGINSLTSHRLLCYYQTNLFDDCDHLKFILYISHVFFCISLAVQNNNWLHAKSMILNNFV